MTQVNVPSSFELTDFDADQRLLAWPGVSLVIFTSEGCGACRWARQVLPGYPLPIERLCWIDSGNNGGLVQRYGVFHLPALFVIKEGQLYGQLRTALTQQEMLTGIQALLLEPAEELP